MRKRSEKKEGKRREKETRNGENRKEQKRLRKVGEIKGKRKRRGKNKRRVNYDEKEMEHGK